MTVTTEAKQELDIVEIKKLLPHRYPFLLVDRVTRVEPGHSADGYKNLTANEQFFEGHFPFKPIMPGVLMIEALAQLACVALLTKEEYKGKLGVFTGIEGVKFRQMVVPGDRLDMSVELVKMKGPLGKMKGTAKVGDKVACEGEFSFAMIEPENK
ncbi:MAG: 3-hydroxyacyl-[acyl-carrier-protein] dehydratase FabZ [Cyanobacteria bacterium PR.3.49]|jgi:3-hydroxyacyl-[acyl-carrier-protein] dehydratase|nr:3-hydroxyacyl-[acyl-carrier-protein] dehydratase FabZ [Cyanobacteria bacterium PR.3.49]